MNRINAISFIFSLLLIAGCGVYIDSSRLVFQNETIVISDNDTLWLKSRIRDVHIDSIAGVKLAKEIIDSSDFPYPIKGLDGGTQELKLTVFLSNGKQKTMNKSIKVVSSIKSKIIVPRDHLFVKHDQTIFTQGLFYNKGVLFESGGLYGESTINRIDPLSGEVLRSISLDSNFFAEGIALFDDTLRLLSWKEKTVFNLDTDLNILNLKDYAYEGWGLCNNDTVLIASDGSSNLYYLDAINLSLIKKLTVYDEKGTVSYMNELEWIDGHIWANVLGKEYIIIIDPLKGRVIARVDFKDIIVKKQLNKYGSFNGIAYDESQNTVYLTGKNWPYYIVWKPSELFN